MSYLPDFTKPPPGFYIPPPTADTSTQYGVTPAPSQYYPGNLGNAGAYYQSQPSYTLPPVPGMSVPYGYPPPYPPPPPSVSSNREISFSSGSSRSSDNRRDGDLRRDRSRESIHSRHSSREDRYQDRRDDRKRENRDSRS